MSRTTTVDHPAFVYPAVTGRIIYLDRDFYPQFPKMIMEIENELYIDVESAIVYKESPRLNDFAQLFYDIKFMYYYNQLGLKKFFYSDRETILVSWKGSIACMRKLSRTPMWEQSVTSILQEAKSDNRLWEHFGLEDMTELFYNTHYKHVSEESALSYTEIVEQKLATVPVLETYMEREAPLYLTVEAVLNLLELIKKLIKR